MRVPGAGANGFRIPVFCCVSGAGIVLDRAGPDVDALPPPPCDVDDVAGAADDDPCKPPAPVPAELEPFADGIIVDVGRVWKGFPVG
jgi:hypothetical protein